MASDEQARRVHVVYGLAKDFGVSGFRTGAVATRHEGVLQAWSNLGYMATIPGAVQEGLAEMLADEPWVCNFLDDNRDALRRSFDGLAAALDREGVPRYGGGAAMFAWLDLRSGLPPNPSFADERRLFERMHGPAPQVEGGGVLLTPGADCYASEPGFFRACWAATPPEAHATAARRIANALAAHPDMSS